MDEDDRNQLLEFREQTVVMLESAKRIVSALDASESTDTEFRESSEDLVRRLQEMVVFTDLILSGFVDPEA